MHRTVFPAIEATFQPNVTYGSAGELQQGVTDMPYAIANVRCENGAAASHVRIGWYRSVYNIQHAFAADIAPMPGKQEGKPITQGLQTGNAARVAPWAA